MSESRDDDAPADEEWSAEASAAELSAMLMSALRLSPEDSPEVRRRAALVALEAASFTPDGNQTIAVLEACDVSSDAELARARVAVGLSHAVDVGRDLAVDFYSLSTSERDRRRRAVATAVAHSRMLTGHFESLAGLTNVAAPPRHSRDAELHALGTLVCLDPDASRKTAASLAVQASKADNVTPLSHQHWPWGKAVFERNSGPPLWLVPATAIGRTPLRQSFFTGKAAGDPAKRTDTAADPPKNRWGVVIACLFGVSVLLRTCAAIGGLEPRPQMSDARSADEAIRESSQMLREIAQRRAVEREYEQKAAREAAEEADRPSGLPTLPTSADFEAARVELSRLGYGVDWVVGLPNPSMWALAMLDGSVSVREELPNVTDAMRSTLQIPEDQLAWCGAQFLEVGEIAPGVPAAERQELRRYLAQLRNNPSGTELAAAADWLGEIYDAQRGRRATPPWRVSGQ